ncbi:exported hypothetical protein [Vibrio nigripulchritudo Wn13]|nr:exported hypothetical protein [Vibrio nigripulchritudo BLFn1]CCN97771.1 exported hypothetical protein [Vibrio nigripulchritudo ENn2]CCO56082.1 exported hypothetical protein [Vibrio nigripulchritudo Wn13]
MKAIKLLGLAAIFASTFALANDAVVFPGASTATTDAPIVFPKEKTPVPITSTYCGRLHFGKWCADCPHIQLRHRS